MDATTTGPEALMHRMLGQVDLAQPCERVGDRSRGLVVEVLLSGQEPAVLEPIHQAMGRAGVTSSPRLELYEEVEAVQY